ncbi:MAG: hypothetical protein ABIA75_03000 [Candidatus Neomarinimicrobiota bacterium]
MKRDRFFVVVLIGIIITGCSITDFKDARLPSWSVNLQFPLTEQTVDLATMLEDSLIQVVPLGANGDSIFVYQDVIDIERVEVGDQLSFADVQESFTQTVDQNNVEVPAEAFDQTVDSVEVDGSSQNFNSGFAEVGIDPVSELINSEIGMIELSDIDPTPADPFQLNKIYPEINAIADGTNDSIPKFTLDPIVNPFSFDDFSAAQFDGGQLAVSIRNDMVITLGSPVVVQFQQVVGIDTSDIAGATVTFATPIAPGAAVTEYMTLTGITLPGDILIQVTGEAAGTQGTIININNTVKTSSFVTEIGGTGLAVTTATAKIPEQTIVQDSTMAMAASENKVEVAKIKTGHLAIDVQNDLNLDAVIDLTIHSLQDDSGQEFSRQINLTANSLTNGLPYPIDGMNLVMDRDHQEIAYTYTIITTDTDPGFATVSSTDAVSVSINMYGPSSGDQLVFTEITGEIEAQEVVENGEIDVSSESNVLASAISSGTINITVDNRINQAGYQGLPALELTIPEIQTTAGDPLVLDPAEVLTPGLNQIAVDLVGYQLVFPDTIHQKLSYSTVVTTPIGELGKYNLQDSIIVTIEVGTIKFSSVTGYFAQDDLIQQGQIQLDEATKIDEARIESGVLVITIVNGVGIDANIDFQIDELLFGGEPLTHSIDLVPGAAPIVETVLLNNYLMDLQLPENYTDVNTNGDYDLGEPFVDANANGSWDRNQQINYRSVISVPRDREMTLDFGNQIAVSVEIRSLSFREISGYISQEDMIQDGQISLDDSTKVDLAAIRSGALMLTIHNNIGVLADVDFTIAEIVDQTGNPFTRSFRLDPASRGLTDEYNFSLEGYSIDLDVNDQTINYQSVIALSAETPMTLMVDNDIQVQVAIQELEFQEVTGIINPVKVEIDTIEQEVTALPAELDGINFANVEMVMDFTSNIGLPVFLDLTITASNADGEIVESSVTNWNISDSSQVVIPDAADLINIKPDKIVAAGRATVGAEGVSGSVAADQYIEGQFTIKAPLELILTDDANIDMEPEEVDTEEFPQELERVVIYAEYDNQFDFGTQIEVLAARDTTYFLSGSAVAPDTLLILDIVSNIAGIDSVILGDDELGLFDESGPLYLKTLVNLLGSRDGQGNPIPSKFLSTDSLNILIYGTFQVLVDPESEKE